MTILRVLAARTRGRGGCPAGKIKVGPFRRKDGTKVKPFCVKDRGAPDRGPKTLPKPKRGGMICGGYEWGKAAGLKERHGALRCITKKKGCGTAIKKLVLLKNLSTDRATDKAVNRDLAWLRRQQFCELKTR